MANRYQWQAPVSEPSYRTINRDHLGWWAAAAMFVSILLHVVVFFALDQVKFVLGIREPQEVRTREVVIRDQTEQIPQNFVPTPPAEDFVAPPPPKDTAKLLEEVDLLGAVKDLEVEMRPDVEKTTVAIQPVNPAASGDPDGVKIEVAPGVDLAGDLPDFGRQDFEMKPAAIGQIMVDPGSTKTDDSSLSQFADNLLKKGAGGRAEKGSLDGLASLDDLIGLPENQLLGKKTMLPSDLLFDFNKYDLRETAKFGLQKLGLLLDNNPTMYCWIEGHTDLIGSDEANLDLSVRRAQAVKRYLVESMGFEPERIVTRGFGRFQPIVTTGDKDQQAPNRRVEIKMRKTPPKEDQIKIAPPKAATVPQEPQPAPVAAPPEAPKAVMVRPNPARAVPVDGGERVSAPEPPKARAIEEMPPRAAPVIPDAPVRAVPVQDDAVNEVLRAQPVTE